MVNNYINLYLKSIISSPDYRLAFKSNKKHNKFFFKTFIYYFKKHTQTTEQTISTIFNTKKTQFT